MVARVARPARKIFLKQPLDLGRFHRKNLYNKDNYLPTTATAVYGIQPQYPEPEATKGCNK
jgi:hypothetical protein